jgi:hypothetical protein
MITMRQVPREYIDENSRQIHTVVQQIMLTNPKDFDSLEQWRREHPEFIVAVDEIMRSVKKKKKEETERNESEES